MTVDKSLLSSIVVFIVFVVVVSLFVTWPIHGAVDACQRICNGSYMGKGFVGIDPFHSFHIKCETGNAHGYSYFYPCEDADGWPETCWRFEQFCESREVDSR